MKQFLALLCVILFVGIASISTKKELKTIPMYTGPPAEISSFTGYLLVRPLPADAHAWYWYFPSQNDKKKDPVIFWLAGGPGCSSMIAAFGENGPYRLNSETSITFNSDSMSQKASVVFLDQTIGSGLTYTKGERARNSQEVIVDVNTAIGEFYRLFPELRLNDAYVGGDSYSGKWVPMYLASLNRNTTTFNFKGGIIGNPSFDPVIQHSIYPDVGYYVGLVDYRTRVEMNILYDQCVRDIVKGNAAFAYNTTCNPMIFDKLIGTNEVSPFDTRQLRTQANYFDPIAVYLNNALVRTALGVNPLSGLYVNCDDLTFTNFIPDMYRGLENYTLPYVISQYRVLLYNGQFDLRVGVLGTVEYLRYMNWTGRAVFNSMRQTLFMMDDKPVGQFKSFGGLSHMVVYGAGHVAARTSGATVTAMVNRFIGPTQSLCDLSTPNCMDRSYECPGNCSSHGTCLTKFNCGCQSGYSSEDCSVGRFTHTVRSKKDFVGTIVGKDVNIYRLQLDGVDTMLNARVTLKRLSDVGVSYVFVAAHGGESVPTDLEIRALVYQKIFDDQLGLVVDYGFPYVNNSYEPVKIVDAVGLQLIRGSTNLLTVVVYNSDDYVVRYSLEIITEDGNGKLSVVGVLTTCLVVIGIIVLAQVFLLIAGYQVSRDAL